MRHLKKRANRKCHIAPTSHGGSNFGFGFPTPYMAFYKAARMPENVKKRVSEITENLPLVDVRNVQK